MTRQDRTSTAEDEHEDEDAYKCKDKDDARSKHTKPDRASQSKICTYTYIYIYIHMYTHILYVLLYYIRPVVKCAAARAREGAGEHLTGEDQLDNVFLGSLTIIIMIMIIIIVLVIIKLIIMITMIVMLRTAGGRAKRRPLVLKPSDFESMPSDRGLSLRASPASR